VNSLLSGFDGGMRLKIIGLSGGAPDCPVSQLSPAQRSAAQSSCDTWTAPTVSWCTRLSGVHWTVSGAPISPEEQRLDMPNLEGDPAPDRLQDLSGGAPDCPVRHSTEGKDSLPCWPPTAPSCLGAIKGTPRRMEEQPKHSLSILKHPNSALTHSLRCVSDLSSIRVVHSLSCHLSSSLHLCAWVCCVFGSCVCCSSQPYSCDFFVTFIVRVRGSNLWRFLANGRKTIRKKVVVFKLIIGSLERG
jgi:hypothetical protein